jgi:hypothetical protein
MKDFIDEFVANPEFDELMEYYWNYIKIEWKRYKKNNKKTIDVPMACRKQSYYKPHKKIVTTPFSEFTDM